MRMRSLLGPNIMSDTILQYMQMDKLHATTAQILALIMGDDDLNKLADIANCIHATE